MADKIPTVAESRTLPIAELCNILGLSVRTIRGYASKGMPHTKGGPAGPAAFSAEECQAWIRANVAKRGGRKKAAPAQPADHAMAAAKLRKELALAERYEMMVAREKGDLVSGTEVQEEWNRRIGQAKEALMSIPPSVAPRIVGLTSPAEIDQIIVQQIRDVCSELGRMP